MVWLPTTKSPSNILSPKLKVFVSGTKKKLGQSLQQKTVRGFKVLSILQQRSVPGPPPFFLCCLNVM